MCQGERWRRQQDPCLLRLLQVVLSLLALVVLSLLALLELSLPVGSKTRAAASAPGTQFTCSTSTNVPVLTAEELLLQRRRQRRGALILTTCAARCRRRQVLSLLALLVQKF